MAAKLSTLIEEYLIDCRARQLAPKTISGCASFLVARPKISGNFSSQWKKRCRAARVAERSSQSSNCASRAIAAPEA